MPRFPNSAIPFFVTASVLFGLTGCVSNSTYVKEQQRSASLDGELAQVRKQNQDLTQQIQQLNDQLQQTKQSAESLAKQKSDQEQLMAGLQSEVAAGQVKITQLAGQLSINMVDKILFNSGSSKLNEAGESVLLHVGQVLKNVQGKDIMISGHTDNVTISPVLRDKFPTNWELSAARATAVARYLQEKSGLPGERLIAAGFSQYRPVAENATPEGREQNRRIELLLVPHREIPAPVPTHAADATPSTAPPDVQESSAPVQAE